MKIRGGRSVVGGLGRWSLSPPLLFFLCLFFFLAGFFGFALFTQQDEWSARPPRLKPPLLKVVAEEAQNGGKVFDPLPHGISGESSLSSIPFQVLSWIPRVLYFPNFATAEQCLSIIKAAKRDLQPSTLALRAGETKETTQGIRTSSGMFMSASEDKSGVLDAIEEKIAKVTTIPRSHGELPEFEIRVYAERVFPSSCTHTYVHNNFLFVLPLSVDGCLTSAKAFNILRYELGQRYLSHYDAFNPAEYGPQKSQRVASFLLYLSDVEEGGETMFPFENGMNMDIGYDYQQCIGLKVQPRRGDGLLFYSVFPNGTMDLASLHGSCPVIRGEKWVATKWIRDQIQED